MELILARASVFVGPPDVSSWTICPAHRSSLGLGWRRGANRCQDLAGLAKHGTNRRKADRGMRKYESKAILRYSGMFLPVGSGKFPPICNTLAMPMPTHYQTKKQYFGFDPQY